MTLKMVTAVDDGVTTMLGFAYPGEKNLKDDITEEDINSD